MHINPIDHTLHQIYLLSEVSDFIREGIQLGIQQGAEEQHCQQILERSFEIRTRIEERLNHEERASGQSPQDHP
jgi:hypothetical protein